ncbi:hypothetical protein HRR76_000755 [Exophiala dermatitidis]|nr:hypothetical protein HRR76_000755 [Exophiala dermatitidis]KAJ4578415.1 hypothetical protein HRR79_001718 [Exophiala dermatitidis]KAJ4593195.1 hypothetical protein HRR84_006702 [Exophiala dermatitidis]KAJ4639460.1 hypothetical protein HRR89_004778 [Exophiala dermatitidis]KAJ4654391.1 hypothetical protein HRR91_003883 [Exophiala dermatitidis]
MALSVEAIVSIVFGVFMAVLAIIALWQVAYYAARTCRTHDSRANSFELEA